MTDTLTTPINFRSGEYDPTRERAYHLSIVLSEDCSAWAVHALKNGETIALAWSKNEPDLSDPRLPANPVSVSYVALPEWSTLVPDAALLPGTEAQHLALVHGSAPKGPLRKETLRTLGATCIFTHNAAAEQVVLDHFPNARPVPLRSLMVRGILERSISKPAMLLHKGADMTIIALAYKHHLLLCNTFPVHTAEDLLYFSLLAVERTGHSPKDVDLFYSGTHLTTKDRDLLSDYFTHADGAVLDPWPNEANDADPADRWLAALEQFACVS